MNATIGQGNFVRSTGFDSLPIFRVSEILSGVIILDTVIELVIDWNDVIFVGRIGGRLLIGRASAATDRNHQNGRYVNQL